ncbi:MAG: glycosyltransferase [Comamonas sp.]|uniref:O-linked N-acetylglucosamine transferase, SPINDLY family protein n=1 Tax=Comamonas sp. TaxID=34028 RepID=UPI002FCBE3AD
MSESLFSFDLPPLTAASKEFVPILTMVEKGHFLEALGALSDLAAKDLSYAKNPSLWLNIGFVYTRLGLWPQVIDALQACLQIAPNTPDAERLLALAYFSVGRKQQACDLIDASCRRHKHLEVNWMMRAYIHAHSSSSLTKTLETARDWGRRFSDPLTRRAKPFLGHDRDPLRKLKIGYVTADFRQHSVAFYMRPILAHHDPAAVEVHVYSNSALKDAFTADLQSLVPYWHEIENLTDEQVLGQIRCDAIDVLVDLSGFTQGHRLTVFSHRAAPVQVTWIGYMNTLGMKAMDYRIADAMTAPPSHAPYYSESLFQLNCVATYTPPSYAPLLEEPPMLRNGYPTLISLNSSSKITDAMLMVWARILQARPDAQLIIMVKELESTAAQEHMQPRVVAAGLPIDRVSVLHQQQLDRFMELGHIADIQLDTAPISGGTTTLHALWMGLPIVTMDAVRGVDACTAGILRSVGITGEIAQDEDDYVDTALRLMNDPESLRLHRLRVREVMKKSPFMDYVARTKEVEGAYRVMWMNWLQGNKSRLQGRCCINPF